MPDDTGRRTAGGDGRADGASTAAPAAVAVPTDRCIDGLPLVQDGRATNSVMHGGGGLVIDGFPSLPSLTRLTRGDGRDRKPELAPATPPATGATEEASDLDRLRQLYEAGATIAQLAEMTGTAVSTLSRKLRRSGARMRPRGAPPHVGTAQVEEWREAYERGESLKAIAAGAGVCFQTVRQYLRQAGVQIRQPGVKLHRKPSRHAKVLPEWQRRYEAGASLGALGAEFGVHRYTIQYALEQAGTAIRKRRSDLAGKPVAAWAEAYRRGESPAAIAQRFGVSDATVRRWLRKQGLDLGRPRRRRAPAVASAVGA